MKNSNTQSWIRIVCGGVLALGLVAFSNPALARPCCDVCADIYDECYNDCVLHGNDANTCSTRCERLTATCRKNCIVCHERGTAESRLPTHLDDLACPIDPEDSSAVR